MLDWHRAHGQNVSLTARHFGVGRTTVYRWLARFDRFHLETLEDRSSAPHRRRRPTWTVEQLRAVKAIRETYPRWGKDKLVVLLRRAGVRLSTSMVGRILGRLRALGRAARTGPSPDERPPSTLAAAVRHPQAGRLAGRATGRPGRTRHPRYPTLSTLVWKQFTARDVVSRWDVVELGRRATAAAAADVLDRLAERMPFPVRAISIDNGSEFMAEFEDRLPGAGHPPVRPAAALPEAARRGGTGQPDPHRRVLRGHRRPSPSSSVLPGRPCGRGRRCTTRSDPTSRWAIAPRPSTWPPSASMCNGGTGASTAC